MHTLYLGFNFKFTKSLFIIMLIKYLFCFSSAFKFSENYIWNTEKKKAIFLENGYVQLILSLNRMCKAEIDICFDLWQCVYFRLIKILLLGTVRGWIVVFWYRRAKGILFCSDWFPGLISDCLRKLCSNRIKFFKKEPSVWNLLHRN